MVTTTENNILASVLNSARQLTHFYLKHADGLDKEKTFTINGFTNTHREVMELLKNLPDAALDEPNNVGLSFGAGDTKRAIIHHAIRHEGVHCGQLGWLLRMFGKKII